MVSEANVYRVHLADPGGGATIHDVPTESLESSERGVVMHGTTIVPWHRVLRYTRAITHSLTGDLELPTHTEIRVWIDDGSPSGETIRVRSDRFEPGPWTADVLVEEAVDVETATRHLTKIHVPWGRILEYERVHLSLEQAVPVRPD